MFENPEGSRKSKDGAEASSNYFVEIITDTAPEFASDKQISKAFFLLKIYVRIVGKSADVLNYDALLTG